MINYHFEEPFWFIEIRGRFEAFNNRDFFWHIKHLGMDAMDIGEYETVKDYIFMLDDLKIRQPLYYESISEKFEKLLDVFHRNTPICHAFCLCKNKR